MLIVTRKTPCWATLARRALNLPVTAGAFGRSSEPGFLRVGVELLDKISQRPITRESAAQYTGRMRLWLQRLQKRNYKYFSLLYSHESYARRVP